MLTKTVVIPEPPRNEIVRYITRQHKLSYRFELSSPSSWQSTADILNLKLNYWEKQPIPGETFYFGDGLLHLVSDTDELKWYYDLAFINCGPKYLEDQYDYDRLQRARSLVKIKREVIEEKVILSLAGVLGG